MDDLATYAIEIDFKNWDCYITSIRTWTAKKFQDFHNLGSQLFIKCDVFLVSYFDVEKRFRCVSNVFFSALEELFYWIMWNSS